MNTTSISKAAFGLEEYKFTEVLLTFNKAPKGKKSSIDLNFEPSGIFYSKSKKFDLQIEFRAFDESKGISDSFIKTTIIATFLFENVGSKDEIPNFFYKNSIAIVYPYIRAFVSNLSLLANAGSLILPTLNLSMLEDTLRTSTKEA